MFEAASDFDLPALVVSLPTERILLATSTARALLAPDESDVRGRLLTEFIGSPDREAAEMVMKGQLIGFQARRRLTRNPATGIELWTRSVAEGDSAVLVILAGADAAATGGSAESASADAALGAPSMLGSVDRHLAVDRVSEDVEPLLGYRPEDLLGRCLLDLISPDDLPRVLHGVAHAIASQHGVCLAVRAVRPDQLRVGCELVLLPLKPAPSFAFSLQPAGEAAGDRRRKHDLRALVTRFERGIAAAVAARELTTYPSGLRPALPGLTTRELQIVSRLMAGDRVPAISQQLYLAQSTVRNHLSAVFAKLGVKSQQELIVLLRRAKNRSG